MRVADEESDDPPAELPMDEARRVRARIRGLHGRYPLEMVEALAGADWATFHRLVEELGIDRVELTRVVGCALGAPRERVEAMLERQQRDDPTPADGTPP